MANTFSVHTVELAYATYDLSCLDSDISRRQYTNAWQTIRHRSQESLRSTSDPRGLRSLADARSIYMICCSMISTRFQTSILRENAFEVHHPLRDDVHSVSAVG